MARGMTAEEVADKIVENIARQKRDAYISLREKCVRAVDKMMSDLSAEIKIELSEQDLMALTKVTEEMRDLNYKFRFIEVTNSSGDTVGHKLLISVAHALKEEGV